MELLSIVVIPARNEAQRIDACLRALAAQTVALGSFEVIVVIDACSDTTAQIAVESAAEIGLRLQTLSGPGRGAGAARQAGMDAAATRLLALNCPQGLIATTDADSRPAPDWLQRQLEHVRLGARAIAGQIELDAAEARALPPGVLARRERDAAARLHRLRSTDPAAQHHHFAGASIGVTAETYRDVGGIEPLAALEDAEFGARLGRHGIAIVRACDVRVRTSARASGRASRGLSVDLAVSSWASRRRYEAGEFPPELLIEHKQGATLSVVIPTKNCAGTIEAVIARTVAPFADLGLIDELVVVDAQSADGTARVAAAGGAKVFQQDQLRSELGPALGKGDAMWRSLHVTSGEIVCFLDGDTRNPGPLHLQGLLGPLLVDQSLELVKGAFARPLRQGQMELPNEGGRVTELMARPLLNLHEPQLAGFAQPLAGEFAGRRELLESIPFPVGYGVEIAVLIDALRRHGLDALAECNLGTRQNHHQPLRALGEMAYAVLAAMENRLGERRGMRAAGHYLRPWEDGTVVCVPVDERPPVKATSAPTTGAPREA